MKLLAYPYFFFICIPLTGMLLLALYSFEIIKSILNKTKLIMLSILIIIGALIVIYGFAIAWCVRSRRRLKRMPMAKVIEMELKMVEVDEKLTTFSLKQMQECQLN